MAGIGITSRALFRRSGVIGPAATLSHGAVIAAGPWIFTVLSIAVIDRATIGILLDEHSYAFRGLVIYAFALSLFATMPVVNVAVRQVADDIFLGNFHEIRPRYVAALILSSLASAAVAGVTLTLLRVSGIDLVVAIAATTVVGLIWPSLAFCSATRDYSGITSGFVIGLVVSIMATVAVAHADWGSAAMMAAFTTGLGLVFFALAGRILSTFPSPVRQIGPQLANLLKGFVSYRVLALGSGIAIAALWMDKWIMWVSPQGVRLENGLISAPVYDGAMFIAYLVIIPALGMFVTGIETTFFKAYRGYFHAIHARAPLSRIHVARTTLDRQATRLLWRMMAIQAILCTVAAMAAPSLVNAVGLQYQQIGILRLGLAAALFQFIFLAATSLLLFFERHGRFLVLQTIFLVCQVGFTLLSIWLGPEYLGLGHLVACAAAAFAAMAVLDRTLKKLVYLTFDTALRQSLAFGSRKARRQEKPVQIHDFPMSLYPDGPPKPLLAP
ncbi:exopolysaccharide Pel transporter PelG [Chelativorans sp. Marseille-P2723]|uniref:exopolysaccharide Pel transporter PelG n=1 Tax=Chelativorans sp. Marseille-P2723 TaxID=2709133 RepID=UPI0015714768|nr:exopolysaccharide Pel transporter PelG [Chelativorans sp. Marseille-P2723]